MNQEIKQRWVEALRSGEYTQTDGCLRDGKGYCCLGVLTDLAIKDGVVKEWEFDPALNLFSVFTESPTGFSHQEDATLPFEVLEWADLDSRNPMVRLTDSEASMVPISDPNDIGFDFKAISELIEDQL